MVQEKIKYTINFLTDWHAGSGLSGGAEADAVVIKDREGFPYVPGKTLKGLFVDAFCDFIALGIDGFTQEKKNELLGYYDPVLKRSFQGKLFFSNAELPQVERDAIDARHKYFLFRTISSTAIDSESGTAKNTSLRTMEVCIPLTLHAYILADDYKDIHLLSQVTGYIRSIGANRNRGLGRCFLKLD